MAVKIKDVIEATYQGLKFSRASQSQIDVVNSCYAEGGIPYEFYFDVGQLKYRDAVVAPEPVAPADPVA